MPPLNMSKIAVVIVAPPAIRFWPPPISKVPAPAIVPAKLLLKPTNSIVPDWTRIVPLSVTAAWMTLMPVPAVFSRTPPASLTKLEPKAKSIAMPLSFVNS